MAERKQAAIIFIFITLLIDVIGIGIIIPVTPALIQELQECTVSEASVYGKWLLLAYAAVQFAFSPLIGAISDRYGRRPVLLASLFGFGVDYLFLAFAPTIGWLFFGRVVAGLMGASFTTGSAYIADVSPPEKRAQNFGLIGVAFGLGFIIGPFLGGYLGTMGSRVPFMVAAGFSLLNWLYGYFILPESLKPENRRSIEWSKANPFGAIIKLRRYPFLLGLIGSIFLFFVASHAVQSTWTYFTMEKFKWNEAQVGASLAVVGILSAVVQGGLIRIVIPKLGHARSLYIGLSLYCTGFILFAFASEGWMLMVFLIPYCLGGISGPAIQGMLSTQVQANEQGELQGILTSAMSLATIVGLWVMLSLFHIYTKEGASVYFPGAPMLLGAVLTIISILFAIRSVRKHSK